MREYLHTYTRILSITPGIRGFGYAVIEGQDMLIDWGIKAVTGDKNNECIVKVEEMINFYKPDVLVMEDHEAKESLRSERIRSLSRRILVLAKRNLLPIKVFTHKKVRQIFFEEGLGTKHALAQIIADQFPEELGHRLPHKRRAWESEGYSMVIFEAVALCIVFRKTVMFSNVCNLE